MRNFYKLRLFLATMVISVLALQKVTGQCIQTFQFPTTTVSPSNPGTTTISAFSYAGDYAVITLTAGFTYTFSSSVTTDYITVTDNANAPLQFGTQPVTFTPTTTGTYRVHFSLNAACGTQNVDRTTSVTSVAAPVGCIQPTQFPTSTITATNPGTTNISSCSYAGEYSVVTLAAGFTYTFSSSVTTDFITVTTATNTILTSGTGTVSFSPSTSGNYRVHWSANSSCGTQSSCRTTSVTSVATPVGCIQPTQFPSATIVATNPGTTTISTCSYAGEYSVVTLAAGFIYTFSSSVATDFITVTTATNTILTSGTGTVTFSPSTSGNYRIHWSTNSSCGTQNTCRTTTVLSATPSCTFTTLFPSTTVNPTNPGTATISTCSFAGEYSNLNLTVGYTYTFSSSVATDFITLTTSTNTVIQTGTGTLTFTPTTTGTYRLHWALNTSCATQNTCRTTTVASACSSVPTVSLGGPFTQCGGSVTLNAGNPGATYAWSTGATTQTISATATGSYTVTVTGSPGCTATASASVTINTPPTVSLGGPYNQCTGTVTLDAGNAGSTYAWSTGATSQTITVSSTSTPSVTVTDANSCTASGSASVTIGSPTVNLGGPFTQCGGSVILDAGNAGSTFVWSTGATTQTINVSSTSTPSVTVTDVNGCTASATASVTINGSLTTTPFSICQGGTVGAGQGLTATGCPVTSFTHTGATTAGSPTFNRSISGSSYTASSVGTAVRYDTYTFTAPVTGSYQFILCGTTPANWDMFGHLYVNSFNPATPATNFLIAADDGAAGCSAGAPFTRTLTAGTTYVYVATAFNNSDFGAYTLSVTGPTAQAIWYTAPTGGTPIATGSPFNPVGVSGSGLTDTNTPGTVTYYAACTNDSACRVPATFTINAAPVVNLGGPYTQCGGNVTLDAGNAGSTFTWSTGANSQTINVSATSTPSVTVTNSNGCTATGSASVTINSLPTVTLGGPFAQCGGSVTLDAGNTGSTFTWSTGESTQTINVTSTSNPSVTVTDGNGCTASASASVTINAIPTVSLGGPFTQCGGTVTLDAGNAGSTFTWSTGANTQTISVSSTATPSVTVTTSSGCTATASTAVTINTVPTVSLGGPFTQCGGTVTLDAGNAGSTFAWSTGATTQTISVSTSSTPSVTVTASNGCTATASASVTINVAPTTTAYTVCQGSAIPGGQGLTATGCLSSSFTYSGATTASSPTFNRSVSGTSYSASGVGTSVFYDTYTFTAPVTGSYQFILCGTTPANWDMFGNLYANSFNPATPATNFLIAADDGAAGCSSGAPFTFNLTAGTTYVYVATAFDNGVFGAYTLSVTGPGPNPTLLWYTSPSGGSPIGSGTPFNPVGVAGSGVPNTNTPGVYTFYAACSTDSTCRNSVTLTINEAPVVTLGGPYTQCGGSVTLDAGNAGSTFAWSTGATTQTISVSSTGTPTVTVTNTNGCTASASASVTINAIPTVNLGGPYTQCGGSVTLDAGNQGSTFAWSSGETTQTLVVSSTSSPSVTVTDGNGCTASASASVTINAVPTVNLGGPYTQCGGSVTLDAGNQGSSFVWSSGETTQTLVVSSSSSPSVTVTDGNGCTASASASVTINAVPTVSLGGPYTQCGGSVTLDAGNQGSGFVWSTGATTQTLVVSSSSSPSVTVTDANGCTASASASVTINAVPTVNLGGPYTQCGGSVTLDAGNQGSSFVWSSGETTQTLAVSSTSSPSVTVTDGNGCTASASASVTINAVPTVNLGGPYAQCGGTLVLDAGNAGASFNWSTGANSQTISVGASGTPSVTVTDANGCTASASASVTINAIPTVNLGGPYTQCGGTVTLDAGNQGSSFVWSSGETTQTLVVSSTSDPSVTVTDVNGCSATASALVTINAAPTVSFNLPTDTVCVNAASVTLTGGTPAGGSFSGTGVSGGTFNPAIAGVGTHTITYTYTNNDGCSGTATDVIVVINCVGVSTLAEGSVSLFPNPAMNMVQVKFESVTGIATIEVMDMTGRLVKQQSVEVSGNMIQPVDITDVSAATYNVRVSVNGQYQTFTVIVQK